MSIWTRFLPWLGAGAATAAASRAAEPAVEVVRQDAWKGNANRVLSPAELAALVAQAIAAEPQAAEHASRNGYGPNPFAALVQLALRAPTVAEALQLWRRNAITVAGFEHALEKAQLEPGYHEAVKVLREVLASPADVAAGVQQGHLPNLGILPDVSPAVEPAEGSVAPLTPDGQPPSTVPLTQVELDPLEQAAGSGVSPELLRLLANLAGLPPGAHDVLAMWNRGLIDEASVDAGIREGHLKTKWTAAFKRMRWAVLTAPEYAEARLRSWITEGEMYAGGALTGHTKSQMDLMFRNRGRPATPRQLWLGWARKVEAPDYPDEPANGRLTGLHDHELAIARSNIRPEYARLLWDVRFNYPSLFQLGRLVQSGAVDSATAATWASYNLEAPEVIAKLVEYWDTLGGATTDPHVGKAQTQLWTATHRAYVKGDTPAAVAQANLELAGVPAGSVARVLELWNTERELVRADLTPKEVKDRVGLAGYTVADALERLEQLGLSAAEAQAFLAE